MPSHEPHERFISEKVRLGLDPDEITHGAIKINKPEGEPVIFSGDPIESDYPGKLQIVQNIHDLNMLIGSPDDADDSNIEYPEPLPPGIEKDFLRSAQNQGELHALIDEKIKHNFRLSKSAYILGNSSKVKDYESLINETHFPIKVVVFSSDKPLRVFPNTIIKKPVPAILCYPEIIYEPSGTLTIEAPLKIVTKTITPDKNGNVVIKASPDDIPPLKKLPTAPNGQKDPNLNGQDGLDYQKDGHTGKGCPWYCRVEPASGKKGHIGGTGGNGQPGIPGTTMSDITFNVSGDVPGKLLITAGGQNGQVGQAGGDGGKGGPGGTKGTDDAHGKCAKNGTTIDGPLGEGGPGGVGGKGGNGGNGGNLIINVLGTLGGFNIIKSAANKGQGGQSGTGGTGIPPGKTPDSKGPGDKNGSPANIVINGVPQKVGDIG